MSSSAPLVDSRTAAQLAADITAKLRSTFSARSLNACRATELSSRARLL